MLLKAGPAASDSVVVIGLGRFGAKVAEALVQLGHAVLGIDNDAEVVQSLAGTLPHVVQADSTDVEALKQLGVGDFVHAVVSIGENLEASVLTGIKRRHQDFIYAKADTVVQAGDLLIVAGATRDVERLAARV